MQNLRRQIPTGNRNQRKDQCKDASHTGLIAPAREI